MSLGRTLADLELRNARTMRAAQDAYDNAEPPEPDAQDDLAAEVDAIVVICEETIGRAQRALLAGDIDSARALLIEAGRDLVENVEIAFGRTE